jgi:microcystin-dependent protein
MNLKRDSFIVEIVRCLGVGLVLWTVYHMLPSARANVPCSLPFPTFVNGTIADATQVNANNAAIVACLGNAAIAGANADITSLTGLTTPLGPTFGGTPLFAATAVTTGAANAQVIANTLPNNFSLTNGYKVSFISGFNQTTAMTLAVGGQAAKNVFRNTVQGSLPLVGGEIVVGNAYTVTYDGTEFVLEGNLVRPGEIINWTSNVLQGWTPADGTCQSSTTQPFVALFVQIGANFGNCGANTFNVPDLRGRVIAGLDNMGTGTGAANRLTSAATGCGTAFTSIGITCANASQSHTQTTLELAQHNHNITDPGHTHPIPWPSNAAIINTVAGGNPASGSGNAQQGVPANTSSNTTGISIQNSGSSTPMPIVNPNMGFYKLIKL